MIRIVNGAHKKHAEVRRLASRNAAPSEEIASLVRGILKDVRENGMKSVLNYARRFDALKGSLKISSTEISKTAAKVDPKVRRAIVGSIRRVKEFHKNQVEKSWMMRGKYGENLGQRVRPLQRIGVYVPGGAGVYPSTLIMDTVPAQVAGVKEIAVVTPCANGLHPAVACAIEKLGITEVYKIGGAQAVALLAYGAGKTKRVDKIVGPANVYASLAKKEVFGTVDIDMIAGPSEIMILADDSADPDWLAADLLSQAEHGSGYEAAVLVTDSKQLAAWVKDCVIQQVENSPKKELLQKVLKQYGRIFVVKSLEEGAEIVNAIAPEHLEVVTRNARKVSEKIENAGAIFIGPWSSEPVGDYWAGPNHVLPTNGTARFASPLGVYDFVKRTSIIEFTRSAMEKEGHLIERLAREEGFIHHAEAVAKRL